MGRFKGRWSLKEIPGGEKVSMALLRKFLPGKGGWDLKNHQKPKK